MKTKYYLFLTISNNGWPNLEFAQKIYNICFSKGLIREVCPPAPPLENLAGVKNAIYKELSYNGAKHMC